MTTLWTLNSVLSTVMIRSMNSLAARSSLYPLIVAMAMPLQTRSTILEGPSFVGARQAARVRLPVETGVEMLMLLEEAMAAMMPVLIVLCYSACGAVDPGRPGVKWDPVWMCSLTSTPAARSCRQPLRICV